VQFQRHQRVDWAHELAGNTINVRLEMHANRVARIGLYLVRPHVCYPFYITCDGAR